jgi:DNA-binding beta-propeller fold protein YncE
LDASEWRFWGAKGIIVFNWDKVVRPLRRRARSAAVILVAGGVASGASGSSPAYGSSHTPYAYVGAGGVIPINLTTNTAGTPIPFNPGTVVIAITPNGMKAYAVSQFGGVTPINTATDTAGTPINVGSLPSAIAITPNGKTA